MRAEWALLVLGMAATGASQTGANNPFASDPQAAESGRAVFRIYCSPCHGIRAQGGRGPDLAKGSYSVGDADADLFRVISGGVPGSEMPSFSDSLGDEGIWRIVAYIRSVARPEARPQVGDPSRGEQFFWGKGYCGQCHRVAGRGGRLGPDLTRAGRQRSLAYLRESIVSPNADLTPGYYTITIVTRDGKRIVGVQKGFDNFSARLMDAEERFYSFDKSEVKSAERDFRSVMPENYGSLFTPAELDDLLAFLASLRGERE